ARRAPCRAPRSSLPRKRDVPKRRPASEGRRSGLPRGDGMSPRGPLAGGTGLLLVAAWTFGLAATPVDGRLQPGPPALRVLAAPRAVPDLSVRIRTTPPAMPERIGGHEGDSEPRPPIPTRHVEAGSDPVVQRAL